MKDVLQSMSPYYYYLVAEGLKPMEIRKSRPNASDWSGAIHVYCTKDKKSFARIPKEYQEKYRSHMGKVGFRYQCDLIEKIRTPYKYTKNPTMPESICLKSRLSSQELMKYIGLGGTGYGWNVSDIVIYDKPKELSKFMKAGYMTEDHYEAWVKKFEIKRPPQSWCYVEEVNR